MSTTELHAQELRAALHALMREHGAKPVMDAAKWARATIALADGRAIVEALRKAKAEAQKKDKP